MMNKIIKGEHFDARLSDTILPWVKENLKTGFLTTEDGKRIRCHYAINPTEKAMIVVSHGFCEFVCKFYEMLYYFYEMGFSVTFPEYRGMGYSDREVEEFDRVHVHDFYEYVTDLKAAVDQVAKMNSRSGHMYLYCHSMGGAVGALYLEKYPDDFEKAVLSSPLMQMNFRGVPMWQVKLLFAVSGILGWNEKYVPGQHGFDNVYTYENSSCMSKPRYDYIFAMRQEVKEYTSYGGTYSWTKAAVKATKLIAKLAHKIETPILLFQAGNDGMVVADGQNEFAKKAKNVSLVRYERSKHEIYNADDDILEDYVTRIQEFFNS